MDLIGIERTKIVSLFFVSNPAGQPVRAEMAAALTQRYNFAVAPAKIEDLRADKVTFAEGAFKGANIESLEIFSDGIVVAAKSPSEKVDEFIEDMLAWSENAFGLKRVETQAVNKIYESHLILKSEKKLFSVLDEMTKVQTKLQELLVNTSNIDAKVEPFGFSFAVDQTKIAGLKPISFRLERKSDATFASNLFYSSAPLKTLDHLALLESIEGLG
jgi:hypothetical protein